MENTFAETGGIRPVATAAPETRARFIIRTYAHVFGAIMAFTAIEVALFKTGAAERIAATLLGGSWLLVLGGFMVVSWLASRVAHSARSMGAQYAALLGFVIAEAIIFVPLLWIADARAPGVIGSAALTTIIGFTGLTAIAFGTGKDFSFLGGLLKWIGFCALGLIVAAVFFDLTLGSWFSIGMIAFAGGAILYDTSNVIRRYPEERYVGAALELFASVALMFWYVLRLFIGSRN
ncbi:MAG: Bax inhibitor-1 family protein [Planctomycetota bacterium]|nr:Bax inhibitor-1 family protein [Planctomycetota bacterium]